MRSKSVVQNLYNPTTGLRPVDVSSFRHVVLMLTVTGAGAASTAVKFRATGQQDVPAFASAASQTNFHTPVQVKNLSDGASVNGATGALVDATGVFMFEVNTNLISWLGLDLTAIGAAAFTIDVVAAGGQD